MKILVSGGAGFIGSHCAEYFAQKNNKVIVVDNLMRSRIFGSRHKSVEYNWDYLSQQRGVTLIKQDIRDQEAMFRLFKKEKPDVVIHTAGQPGVRFSLDQPLEDFSINAAGSIILLEALRHSNPKGQFIFCSTNKVYGSNVNQQPITTGKKRYEFKHSKGVPEDFGIDLAGHTPYGVSKLAADLYAQDYAYAYGLKSGIFRMSCIYGTRQFGFEDQGWLAWFSIKYFLKQPVTIYGDGKQIRDVLWVSDLIKAFEAFINSKQKLHGEVFNLGGGEDNTISLLELTEFLEELTQTQVKIKFANWRQFDQKVYVSDIRKAKKSLRWQPTVNPQEGIQRLYHWIQQNPQLFKTQQ